jgi:protein phosphatase
MNKLKYSYLSKQGTYRSVNQDSLALPTEINTSLLQKKGYLFAVCDGVGGYEGGEIASKLCCSKLINAYYEEKQDEIKGWFQTKIQQINKYIIEHGQKNDLHKMSTTLTALLIKDNKAYTFNVGDSRIYIYENSQLQQLTDDHSLVWEQYEKNLIEKDDIISSSIKNLITQAMGFEMNLDIQIKEFILPENFCFLLCSDGLTDVSIDDEIEMIFNKQKSLDKIVDKLYKIARENGAQDDVSIIVVSNYLEKRDNSSSIGS